jgi:hypothetical protein
VDFIQDNPATRQAVQEALRVFHHPPHPRQFTVEVLCLGQSLAEAGFPHAPHPGQPDDGPLPPGPFNELQPKVSLYHMQPYLHIVSLNAFTTSLGIGPHRAHREGSHNQWFAECGFVVMGKGPRSGLVAAATPRLPFHPGKALFPFPTHAGFSVV